MSRKLLREAARTPRTKVGTRTLEKCGFSKIEGIDQEEIARRKCAGECLHCAWRPDRKGTHRVKNWIRPIELETGTAGYSKQKNYQPEEFSSWGMDSDTSLDTEGSPGEE